MPESNDVFLRCVTQECQRRNNDHAWPATLAPLIDDTTLDLIIVVELLPKIYMTIDHTHTSDHN